MEALISAINLLGGQSALSRELNTTPQAVHNWLARKSLPAEHCPAIERATNGQVRCEDLRPDVDWAVLRCDCAEKAGHDS
jgi:DNA-binding transcriptional regulator YdaS (Cro superfamily)